MIDPERDKPSQVRLEYAGTHIILDRNRYGHYVFLKGTRKELPKELSGSYLTEDSAFLAFRQYVRGLVGYRDSRTAEKKLKKKEK